MFDNIKQAGLFLIPVQFVGGKLCIFFPSPDPSGIREGVANKPCQNFRPEIAYNTTDPILFHDALNFRNRRGDDRNTSLM